MVNQERRGLHDWRASSLKDVLHWLELAKEGGFSHLVLYKNWMHDDYPLFTNHPVETDLECEKGLGSVFAVFSVNKDWAAQLTQYRAFDYT